MNKYTGRCIEGYRLIAKGQELYYTILHMGILLKGFAIFWVIWVIWYITGGPLRDDKTKPYVGFTESGNIEPMGTSSLKR